MREVIRIPELTESKEECKPIKYTHRYFKDGFKKTSDHPSGKVIYLGRCEIDGDMFAEHTEGGEILIYTGHLNSGKY